MLTKFAVPAGRKLQRLVLEDCSELTDDWIAPVAKRCGELTDLDLTWCNQLTDAGCDRLAAGCPRYTFLNMGTSASF